MFSATRRFAVILALGVGFILPAQRHRLLREIANNCTTYRHLFPGRMTGSLPRCYSPIIYANNLPRWDTKAIFERLSADLFIPRRIANRKNRHNVTGTVIAAHEGRVPQQIIIMAHRYVRSAERRADVDANSGAV